MNIKAQLVRAFVLSFLCAAGFGLIALFIQDRKIASFDQTVTGMIQAYESPAATAIMKGFTFIGSGRVIAVLVPAIALILYKVLGRRAELIFFIGVNIGSSLLNVGLKTLFHRARPTIHRIVDATGYSFPSGHSMAAFTLYGVTAFLLWRHTSTPMKRLLLLLFSGCMIMAIGISRIYLGVHYPSDVLGGYLASGTWLVISIWFFRRYIRVESTTT